jgi:endonuclease G, mitochondrial
LLTNHHVLPTLGDARGVGANFLYEQDERGTRRGLLFELDADAFYVSDEALDYAVVAVKSVSLEEGRPLDDLGLLTLIEATPKSLIGDPVNIIQHPEGGSKRYAAVQNKLLDILDEGFLHYETDTLEGSSGSPAFSQNWEIIALHHTAVPALRDGKVLARDGSFWDEEMGDAEVRWIANEGARISAIVKSLASQRFADPARQATLERLLATTTDPVSDVARVIAANPVLGSELVSQAPILSVAPGASSMTHNQFTFTGPVTIHVYAPVAPQRIDGATVTDVAITSGARAVSASLAAPEKVIQFDPDYDNRKGYDPLFLSTDVQQISVPAPGINPARIDQILVDESGNPKVLKYHHFELVMNKPRQLQVWSAVNVDYNPARKTTRSRKELGTDKWIVDPRIPKDDHLLDKEFYSPATRIDLGHMVRREDNAWGDSELEIEHANSDTFHLTNATPQHEAFNRSNPPDRNGDIVGLWGDFENYIQENLTGVDSRACILAGPVLNDETDPVATFAGKAIKYPVLFWKVIAVTVTDAQEATSLKVFGFLLSQKGIVDRFGIERFRPGRFGPQQASLQDIETAAGVIFAPELHAADQAAAQLAPLPIAVGPDILGFH